MPRETSDRGGIARTDVEGEAGSGVIAVAHSAIEPPEPPPSVLERIVHLSCTGRSKHYFYVTKYRD